MLRALLYSSSGGQIVLVQHLVSSLSLGDCSVHRLRAAILFNKTCRIRQLTPTYINITANGNNSKSERTGGGGGTIRYRINQELKFKYAKKTTTERTTIQDSPGM